MKTTKKTTSKSTAKKTDVKKNIESKIISQPSQSEVVKTQSKVTNLDKDFTYVTTFPLLTFTTNKEIVKFLKSESKEVRERIEERKIKILEIVKLSKYGHKQLLNGKLKSSSMKYFINMKNGMKYCLNFANYENEKK
jgi:hypothetical protein